MSIVINVFGLNRWMEAEGINWMTLFSMAMVIGFTGSFISLWISKWMAKTAYNIQIIEKPRNAGEQWLLQTVAAQAKKARIPMPEVGIYDSPEANAFATGPSKKNSLVAVSSGLLQQMTRDEVEGVLAHEVAHIANGDMVTMALVQGVLNTFVVFLSRAAGYFVDKVVFKNERGPGIGYFISSIVFEILLGFLAAMIVMSYSRRREFHADADAARIWGKQPMIDALKRLQQITAGGLVLDERGQAFSAFKINGKQGGLMALFSSHPPLEERIAALERLRV
jgi:heat shock protein HtpX